MKFSSAIIRQGTGQTSLLNNSKASYSANSSHKGIDSRIILYDCFIGGAVIVGLSRAAHWPTIGIKRGAAKNEQRSSSRTPYRPSVYVECMVV